MIHDDEYFAGGSVETIEDDLGLYLAEVEKSDRIIADLRSLDFPGCGAWTSSGSQPPSR